MRYSTVSRRRLPKKLLPPIIAVAVLLVLVVILIALPDGDPDVSPAPPAEIGSEAEIEQNVPRSKYDPTRFRTDTDGTVTYDGRYAAYGIDVSELQGAIDWAAVAEDGIDFAMIRLGYRGYTKGELYADAHYAENADGAAAAGLDVGVYFFSQALTVTEAEEEARFVLEQLDGRELQYPVVFDWERIDGEKARTDAMDNALLTECAAAFCRVIEEAGYRPGVYFNAHQGYASYDLATLWGYEFWLAEYGDAPEFRYCFDMWQYTDAGNVAGISTKVDRNICFKQFD